MKFFAFATMFVGSLVGCSEGTMVSGDPEGTDDSLKALPSTMADSSDPLKSSEPIFSYPEGNESYDVTGLSVRTHGTSLANSLSIGKSISVSWKTFPVKVRKKLPRQFAADVNQRNPDTAIKGSPSGITYTGK